MILFARFREELLASILALFSLFHRHSGAKFMREDTTVHQFSYTAKRSSYAMIVGVFIFLFFVEGGTIELLVTLLVHLLWLRIFLLLLAIGLHLYVCLMLLLPFWTRHSITRQQLHLHYGSALNVYIPLGAIDRAQAINERISPMQSLGARYDGVKQRIIACFSDQGMLLLTFHSPLILNVGFLKRTTTGIVLNVDQRSEFLNALATAKASIVTISSQDDEMKHGHA